MTKNELVSLVRQRLGCPMVKVELSDGQILNEINYARNKFIKWAAGQATQETYFTIALSAGQNFYELPSGVLEVINYDDTSARTGGINTLFSIENYLFMHGAFDNILRGNFGLISYHIALDFMETLKRYTPNRYNWKYHRFHNILEIQPTPVTTRTLLVPGPSGSMIEINSPGYVLLKTMMIEGSTLPEYLLNPPTSGGMNTNQAGVQFSDFLWEHDWIQDMTTARCKVTLGMIRRKFANFTAIGSQGLSFDGDSLVNEGKEEIADLEIKLREEECHVGYGFIIG